MLLFRSDITAYFLPEDGEVAKTAFLKAIEAPGETWISAYSFCMPELFEAVLRADANGVVVHLLLDHTQATTPSEARMLSHLVQNLHYGEVIVTTAGWASSQPSAIWHMKGMVVASTVEGEEDFCWEGSVNFSPRGWSQGNTALSFHSNAWSAAFRDCFRRHADWALEHCPQYQISTLRKEKTEGEKGSQSS